jgi:ABC-type antimicrobial peptide transport system permease subunit
MYFTFLRRELVGRRRQTLIIAVGMALAIALVIVVNAFALGVKDAQAKVLESVYGVGTDMTVTQTPTFPTDGKGGRQMFDFGANDGQSADGTQSVSRTRLGTKPGPDSATMPSANLATVQATAGVKAAAATLALENTTFSGQLPNPSQQVQMQPGQQPQVGVNPGGIDGKGGSSFSIDSFSVLGVDPAAEAIGPLASVTLTQGKGLTPADAGKDTAVVDSGYATTNKIAVGDTISLGGVDFAVVGIVTSTSSDSSSAANVYIPLDVAQTLSGHTNEVSTIYVQATSSTEISTVQKSLETALPDTSVKTQSDLASSVSGSLSTAATLLDSLGLWLSIIVLAAAFLIAILFTISGVTRRTREFGTLKAIGWSNGRITGQVAGESIVQSALGGVIGVVLGIVGILIINLVSPTLSGSTSGGFMRGGAGNLPQGALPNLGQGMGPGSGMLPGGFGRGANPFAAASQTVTLHAPFSLTIMFVALGLAIAGGLIAGALGGWRAARLSPAAALRSVN